jgi:hypothetical protein
MEGTQETTMKAIFGLAISASVLIGLAAPAMSQGWTSSYIRRDGTYVGPYHHTMPDSNPFNNYSTRGNTNPYTGAPGTVDPYRSRYGTGDSGGFGGYGSWGRSR